MAFGHMPIHPLLPEFAPFCLPSFCRISGESRRDADQRLYRRQPVNNWLVHSVFDGPVNIFHFLFAYIAPLAQEERHRVYLSFMDRRGWQCQSFAPDPKTPLPRKLHFTSSDKIVELVERGGNSPGQESRLMLDHAFLGDADCMVVTQWVNLTAPPCPDRWRVRPRAIPKFQRARVLIVL
jgi:hypothetical protein